MDAKFDVVFQPNMGSNLTKSFITGLSLFLLEPVFWFKYDYNMNAVVDLYQNRSKVKTITASTSADMEMKFLSLGDAVSLESKTLAKAKESLFKQIFKDLENYHKTMNVSLTSPDS